ncbi:anti-sigma factor RsbA family regulatory protein [Prauserella alba]|uniref:Sensor histidine kinase n=1 Tax=Prauserella alba TaxID=176898 RepID=A0ABP4G9P4_9PSEU|nr:anti-sigma factor RsbA family regulatory protein [Prauserella alba]MCP2180605.1 Anti-sigma regulatory factor (Ser/Thr protein kinase) [Prauserella alba]
MTTRGESVTGQFSHEAFLYRDEDAYVKTITAFVVDGVHNDEPVALALPTDKLSAVGEFLGDTAADVEFVDMAEAGRNPAAILSGVLRSFADGHDGRVRVVGEPIWPGRSAAECTAAVEHEALVNEAFAGSAALFLCPYDASRLGRAVLDDVAATHPELVDETGRHASDAYAPHAVVDGCNRPLPVPSSASTLRFDLHTLAEARRFAAAHAECHGVDGGRLPDVALVVGELAANSVQHGGGSGTLRVWQDAVTGAVVCQVDDAGSHTDPFAGRVPVPADQLGGRGLLLVNRLADLVRTYRGVGHTATRVWFDR